MVNRLASEIGMSSLVDVLAAYSAAGIDLGSAIDGGAGSGSTAVQIEQSLGKDATVFAYEPFPANHQFFPTSNARIVLRPFALGDSTGKRVLHVSSVVHPESSWGTKGLVGYSSVGYLGEGTEHKFAHDVTCDVVRGDDDFSTASSVGFVKLDLQGGEAAALRRMRGFFADTVKVAWIECLARPDSEQIVSVLSEYGFLLFDTDYLFQGSPNPLAQENFVVKGTQQLSTGSMAWSGIPRHPWVNFSNKLTEYRGTLGLIQTDLIAVNSRFVGEFVAALCAFTRGTMNRS